MSPPATTPTLLKPADVEPLDRAVIAHPTVRVRDGRDTVHDDRIAVEEPLEIRVVSHGGSEPVARSVAITMRTPGHDFELAVGFLFAEGILTSAADVERVSYCLGEDLAEQQFNVVNVEVAPGFSLDERKLARNFFVSSSCGVCGKATLEALDAIGCRAVDADGLRVPGSVVSALQASLRAAQDVFDRTGGVHAAGLFRADGRLVVAREDVGRHNAVDKVVGARFLDGDLPLSGHIIVVSGRASFEIVQKAAMAGIPVVAAVGAPSSLAIATAAEFGITLIGFLAADRFNVYANPDRIQLGTAPA